MVGHQIQNFEALNIQRLMNPMEEEQKDIKAILLVASLCERVRKNVVLSIKIVQVRLKNALYEK